MQTIKPVTDFLFRHRRHVATVAFFAGFFVDIITFRTINLTISQIILTGYLLIVAGSILILSGPVRTDAKGITKHVRTWLPIVHQYVTGNLLSAFLVLYFSSGSFSQSWPFLIIVALAALSNETSFFEKYRTSFQTTLFFFNLVLFFALAVPIAFGSLGLLTFLSSIGVSILVFILFFLAGKFFAPTAFKDNGRSIIGGALGMCVLVVALYMTHLIPPIPLSAKNIDVYHSVEKVGDTYVVLDEVRTWYERFLDIGGVPLHLGEGESAYVYTSVFAPARFGANIVHRWEMFDEDSGEWISKNTVRFPILGGRPNGYRGYSFMENPVPGHWRVSVETPQGGVIGRVELLVVRVATPVDVIQKTLE
ncbi:MAG: DUF2914 domain-containing protein [Patescibacteria group bacterium]